MLGGLVLLQRETAYRKNRFLYFGAVNEATTNILVIVRLVCIFILLIWKYYLLKAKNIYKMVERCSLGRKEEKEIER